MPTHDLVTAKHCELLTAESSSDSGPANIAADIWSKASSLIKDHPVETGAIAITTGLLCLRPWKILTGGMKSASSSGTEAALGTEALLSRGLPITTATRSAMAPGIKAMHPAVRPATESLVSAGLPIAAQTRGLAISAELAAMHPARRLPTINAMHPAVRPATESLVGASVPITAQTRELLMTAELAAMHPARRLATLKTAR